MDLTLIINTLHTDRYFPKADLSQISIEADSNIALEISAEDLAASYQEALMAWGE